MIIEIDYIIDSNGVVIGTQTVDTRDIDVIHVIKGILNGAINAKQAGWGDLTNHPDHQGQTRFDVLKGEIDRKGSASDRELIRS